MRVLKGAARAARGPSSSWSSSAVPRGARARTGIVWKPSGRSRPRRNSSPSRGNWSCAWPSCAVRIPSRENCSWAWPSCSPTGAVRIPSRAAQSSKRGPRSRPRGVCIVQRARGGVGEDVGDQRGGRGGGEADAVEDAAVGQPQVGAGELVERDFTVAEDEAEAVVLGVQGEALFEARGAQCLQQRGRAEELG